MINGYGGRLAALWVCWCLLHSLLISSRVTGWLRAALGKRYACYRLVYVWISVGTVIPLAVYQQMVPQHLLFAWRGPWRLGQVLLLAYGAGLFWAAARAYDMGRFLGLRQWREYRAGRQDAAVPFQCHGILGHVRHPWYSGGVALVIAAGPATDVSLPVKAVLVLYLVVGTFLEERKLVAGIGEPYREYRRRVPRLIPRLTKGVQ